MQSYRSLLGTLIVVAGAASAHAAVLDDFSTNSTAKYDYYVAYDPQGHPDNSNTYAISGGAFTPNMRDNETNLWTWNQGEKITAIGDSVSIKMQLNNHFAGFVLANSSSTLAATSSGEWDLTNGGWANPGGDATYSGSYTGPFTTLTVTKTAADTYVGTVAGGGITASWTKTITGSDIYFSIDQYSGGSSGGVPLDDLTFTPVPEPTSVGFLGAASLAALSRRRRR